MYKCRKICISLSQTFAWWTAIFSSTSYIRGREMYSIYSSTKVTVINYAQEITDEWADDGILVNVINPQRTMIPMRLRPFGEESNGTL